jgi:murein DD-endopeptidase MepM/ murein hydrolase activator NlpD
MLGATCPKCASSVALHEGMPIVTTAGVELWHSSCWAVRHARPVEEVTVIAPPIRDRRRWPWAAGLAAIVLGVLLVPRTAPSAPAASLATIDVDPIEAIQVRAHETAREIAPAPAAAPTYDVPIVDGLALDEQFPSLVDWTHPVTGTTERVPEQASRHFGAERKGIERPECGAGHCGVDLDGPRGRPVVAVTDGVVVRVERHELGLDGRSGRYVRIEHDDGTLTAYMHLDEIADGLEVGDHVDGGQYIGTLGATAVYAAVPHLHFSLEVPNVTGTHGDNTNTHYVDPAPFLARAAIAPVPDRRHATKPAL